MENSIHFPVIGWEKPKETAHKAGVVLAPSNAGL